jgi:hypothetical protein
VIRAVIAGLLVIAVAACAARAPALDGPSDPARHRAALAVVTVSNETGTRLEIAFRTATPPVQETILGRVEAGARAALPPVPAGEPIILVARRADGAEYQAKVQSFPLDGAVEWTIPMDAVFRLRETAK